MSTALPAARVLGLTGLAMAAFAGNSLLCQQALQHTAIDPASFTTVGCHQARCCCGTW